MTKDPDLSQPSTKPATSSPSRGSSALSLLNLVVLLASLGLLGYLIYMQRQESTAEKPVKEAATKATKAEKKIEPEIDKLKGEVKDLARKVEEIPAPPNYAPQIKALDDRVADLGKTLADLTDRLETLGKKVDGLSKGEGLEASPRFEAVEKHIAEVAATLEVVKANLANMTTPAAMASNEMDQGVALFKQGKWAEAKEAFAKLQALSPDDARVWYFSALTTGLASKNWKGESERLVAEGMAREKAGKPEKAKIDAAFSDLTTATGKDWLAFYRNRASQSPENR